MTKDPKENEPKRRNRGRNSNGQPTNTGKDAQILQKLGKYKLKEESSSLYP
jgi:hypothetical protein